mgnify:CR=1 FL=1
MENALSAFVRSAHAPPPKVAVSDQVPAGRGLALIEDVAPGTLLLRVPSTCLLNPARLARGEAARLAPRRTGESGGNARLSTHQFLALLLALWRAASRASSRPVSRLDAFFESLPPAFDTAPLTWATTFRDEPLARALLKALPDSARMQAADVHTRFRRDWRRIRQLQTDDVAGIAAVWRTVAAQDAAVPPMNESDFVWAWMCVNSRCVFQDLGYAAHTDNFTLAPLLDMANHTAVPDLECKVQYDMRSGLDLRAPQGQKMGESNAAAGLRCGDEVCITYGPHSNATLLAEYGFVLPLGAGGSGGSWDGSRFCGVCVDGAVQQMLEDQGEGGAWKRALLEQSGYWGDYTLHPVPEPAHPSHRLHLALRLACVHLDTDRRAKRPRVDAEDRDYTQEQAERIWRQLTNGQRERISSANEAAVCASLVEIADRAKSTCAERAAELRAAKAAGAPKALQPAAAMVLQLLEEEQRAAELVRASAQRGDAW